MNTMRLLILGTGGMGNQHAAMFKNINGVELVAAVDTQPEKLNSFCHEHGIAQSFNSLEDALAWGKFDAACNVTPDRIHHPTTLPLLSANKHVLCEKPLADNYNDALEMTNAARDAGVVNMVNLSYRNVGVLHQARELVAAGVIGDVRHVEASYLQSWLTQPAWGNWKTEDQWLWRLSKSHGSLGVLGDVGVHILDFATFAVNKQVSDVSCRLKTFHKAPNDKIGDYALDANDSFAMHITLEDDCIGVVHASRFASGHLNDLHLRIYGTTGGIELANVNWKESLSICTGSNLESATWESVEPKPVTSVYQRFADAVLTGSKANPDFARGAEMQKIIDLAVDSDNQSQVSLGN